MKSFKDLDVEELRRSAVEDFAVDIDDKASKEELIAAFLETGVEWKDYVAQHPEVAEDEPSNVVTSGDVTGKDKPVGKSKVRTAEPVIRPPGDQYLVKMVRENTLFETRGHRFTQEHPYALVNAADADYILSKEDGFRQALPSELEEFYG